MTGPPWAPGSRPAASSAGGRSSRPVLLEVRGLSVTFAGGLAAVESVGFTVRAGQTLGLVGSSGSGKTMTALGILGLTPRGARVEGEVLWQGRDLLTASADRLRRVRGAEIGLVPQDPSTALHPLKRVDRQVAEAVRAHAPELAPSEAARRAAEALESMGLPGGRLSAHPFEWSGGMRQRALLAMAVVNRPQLLIADEPTTALDALTQDTVLELLRSVQAETGAAILLISHDLAVIQEMADSVAVMERGRIVETSCPRCLRRHPRHPRTADLVAALDPGRLRAAGFLPEGRMEPVLEVRRLSVRYPLRRPKRAGTELAAVRDVGLELRAGETLALVGESGAGKSSLARALLRLEDPGGGEVLLEGRDLIRLRGRELRRARAGIQIVFQEHHASLNPRRCAADSVAEPLRIHRRCGRKEARRRALRLLADVGLQPEHGARLPHALSGGQRQRVAIARALALSPRVLVLDEPVTSVDAVTRLELLRLLVDLQDRTGVAYLLIAHDLHLVLRIAHRIAVMHEGRIVETGPSGAIAQHPEHPYTRRLLAAGGGGDPGPIPPA